MLTSRNCEDMLLVGDKVLWKEYNNGIVYTVQSKEFENGENYYICKPDCCINGIRLKESDIIKYE